MCAIFGGMNSIAIYFLVPCGAAEIMALKLFARYSFKCNHGGVNVVSNRRWKPGLNCAQGAEKHGDGGM